MIFVFLTFLLFGCLTTPHYLLTVEADTGGSIVLPEQSPIEVDSEKSVNILAKPDEGYQFVNWTIIGDVIGGDEESISTYLWVKEDTVVTAHFKVKEYQLSVESDIGGSILMPVSSPINVGHNNEVSIEALADDGYEFANWSTSDEGVIFGDKNSPSTTVKLTKEDALINAHFIPNIYQLTLETSSGGSILMPTSPSISVISYKDVNIEAQPDTNYRFSNWTTTDTGVIFGDEYSMLTTVSLTQSNATITANFELDTYQLSVDAQTGGSIVVPTSSPITVDNGVAVNIEAQPDVSYNFVKWTTTDTGVIFDDVYSATTNVTLTEEDAIITANFLSDANSHQLTIQSEASGTIIYPVSSPITVENGVSVPIEAEAFLGYEFGNWSTTDAGVIFEDENSASTSVTLTSGDAVITAHYVVGEYMLTVVAGAGGTIVLPSSSPITVIQGIPVNIEAQPDTGYRFVNWTTSDEGVIFGDESLASTFVDLTEEDATITANFEPIPVYVDVNYTGGNNDGSKEHPFIDIEEGMTYAKNNNIGKVYVATGIYDVTDPITLVEGVALYGGWDNDNGTWTRYPYQTEADREQYLTQITYVGDEIGDNIWYETVSTIESVDLVNMGDIVIEGFTINSRATGNSISAIFLDNDNDFPTTSNMTLQYNTINSGDANYNTYGIFTYYAAIFMYNNVVYGGDANRSYPISVSSNSYSYNQTSIIENNTVNGGYGAEYYRGISCSISDNIIRNNLINGGSGNDSMGISGYGDIIIESNIINVTENPDTSYGIYSNTENVTGNIITINSTGLSYGIYQDHDDAFVDNNAIFITNSDTAYGLYVNKSDMVTLKNNSIYDDGNNDVFYGVYNYSSPDINIQRNIINDNDSNTFYGIYNCSSDTNIQRNEIYGDSSSNSYGIFNVVSSPTIQNNTINAGNSTNNTCGIYNMTSSFPAIQNNTINGGSGTNSYGIYSEVSSSPTIQNNIIFTEGTGNRYGIYEGSITADVTVLQNNDIFDCPTALYYDIDQDADLDPLTGTAGLITTISGVNALSDIVNNSDNVSVNPEFVDQSGNDWHLGSTTPLIVTEGGMDLIFVYDFPENTYGYKIDKDSNIRTGDGSIGWSMGAYEYD